MTSAITQDIILRRVKVTKNHDDFDIAAQSNTINVGSPIPANAQVLSLSVECTEAPSGGGVVSYDMQVGDAVDSAGFVTAEDHIALGTGVYQAYGAYITTAIGFDDASKQITATVTVDGAHNTEDVTAGEWTFRILYAQFGD